MPSSKYKPQFSALLTCALIYSAAPSRALAVDVELDYKYAGAPVQPARDKPYCLTVKAEADDTELSLRKVKQVCADAAGVKGYNLNGRDDCADVKLTMSVRQTKDDTYTKTCAFEFFERAQVKPNLVITGKLTSSHKTINELTVTACCRAAFHEVPENSGSTEVVSRTDLDDAVNGHGFYGSASVLLNGSGLAAGYYLSERAAIELSYFRLFHSTNMDADEVQTAAIQLRYFFDRQVYAAVGPALREASFSQGLYFDNNKITSNPDRHREIHGRLTTAGVEGAFGRLLRGASHQQGLLIGVDFIGGYMPSFVVNDKIELSNTNDASMRDHAARTIAKTHTYYVLKLNLGYAL